MLLLVDRNNRKFELQSDIETSKLSFGTNSGQDCGLRSPPPACAQLDLCKCICYVCWPMGFYSSVVEMNSYFSVDMHPLCIVFFVSCKSILTCRTVNSSQQLIILLTFQIREVMCVLHGGGMCLCVLVV